MKVAHPFEELGQTKTASVFGDGHLKRVRTFAQQLDKQRPIFGIGATKARGVGLPLPNQSSARITGSAGGADHQGMPASDAKESLPIQMNSSKRFVLCAAALAAIPKRKWRSSQGELFGLL